MRLVVRPLWPAQAPSARELAPPGLARLPEPVRKPAVRQEVQPAAPVAQELPFAGMPLCGSSKQ